MHTLKDVYQAGLYFFSEPDYSSAKELKFREKHPTEMIGMSSGESDWHALVKVLTETTNRLQSLTDWDKEHISEAVKQVGEDLKLPAKLVMQVIRFAVAGLEPGVGVPVIIQILGKKKVLSRLKACQPSDKAI